MNSSPYTSRGLVAAAGGYEVSPWQNLFHGGSSTTKMVLPNARGGSHEFIFDGDLLITSGWRAGS
jgi:hypothetical protein